MVEKIIGSTRGGAFFPAFMVLAAMLGGPELLASPGAPAPVRMLPICQQLSDPPTGACPLKSDYLTIASSGSFDGSASVAVTVSPSIPPCATKSGRDYSPATCYTQILVVGGNSTFAAPRCEYLDDATGLLKSCLVPYRDSFASWGAAISLSGDWRYAHGLPPGGCAAVSNFAQYFEGGPSGSGQTWPELAALTGECLLSMDRTPDNLMGASWVVVSGLLEVVTNGSERQIAIAETYVGVNGTLGPFAEVIDPDPDPDPEDTPVIPPSLHLWIPALLLE
jgi:hypothetical protein